MDVSISETLTLADILLVGSIMVNIVDSLRTSNEDDCNTTDVSVTKVELIGSLDTTVVVV